MKIKMMKMYFMDMKNQDKCDKCHFYMRKFDDESIVEFYNEVKEIKLR